MPPLAEHWWIWWEELAQGRQAGFALCPISWSDLYAWSRLTGRVLARSDIAAIRAIDTQYLSIALEKRPERK